MIVHNNLTRWHREQTNEFRIKVEEEEAVGIWEAWDNILEEEALFWKNEQGIDKQKRKKRESQWGEIK